MDTQQERPWHFSDLQRQFPNRTDDEISDAIIRLRKHIGSAKNRDEIMTHLNRELGSQR